MTSQKALVSLHLTPYLSYYGGGHTRLKVLSEYTDPEKCRLIVSSLTEIKDFEPVNGAQDTFVHAFKLGGKSFEYKIRSLRRFVKRYDVDIIHAYNTHCQFLAAIVGRLAGIPVAVWEIGIAKYGRLTSRLIDMITEFLIQERVCNSISTSKAIQSYIFPIRSKWSVLYPGVPDRRSFSERTRAATRKKIRSSLGLTADDVAISTIGGFIGLRDFATTINAFAVLVSEGIQAKLILVGDGPQRRDTEDLVRKANLVKNVLFLGYIKDAPDLLPGMDIYINGAYAEGFGFATVEAMLAGLPVIAADAAANSEVVEHYRTGLLVKPMNVDHLVAAVKHLLDNRMLMRMLGETAREVALDRFSPEKFAQRHFELCQRLVGETV